MRMKYVPQYVEEGKEHRIGAWFKSGNHNTQTERLGGAVALKSEDENFSCPELSWNGDVLGSLDGTFYLKELLAVRSYYRWSLSYNGYT